MGQYPPQGTILTLILGRSGYRTHVLVALMSADRFTHEAGPILLPTRESTRHFFNVEPGDILLAFTFDMTN